MDFLTFLNNLPKNSQISNSAVVVFALMFLILTAFLFSIFRQKKKLNDVQKYYVILCLSFISWLIALIGMRFVDDSDLETLRSLEAMTYVGVGYIPYCMFFICVGFVNGRGKVPNKLKWLLVFPSITNGIVWTNEWHHLMYKHFSIIRKDLVFGPYFIVHVIFTYLPLVVAAIIMLRYLCKAKDKTIRAQTWMLILGMIAPISVSVLATFFDSLSIAATPLSFAIPVICNYIAIYRLNILDVIPLATEKVLDLIPDGFLILDAKRCILDYNQSFANGPGKILRLEKNTNLDDRAVSYQSVNGGAMFGLLTNIRSCTMNNKTTSFEQNLYCSGEKQSTQCLTYLVSIQVIEIKKKFCGHIVIYRDITELKASQKKNDEDRERLMEQERMAMLGQMMGGMAHNLKTPIMGIAGGAANIETLMKEVTESLGDPEVTVEDYREIVKEVNNWLTRIRDSCTYMSDMITAVKGQAAAATQTETKDFLVDKLLSSTEMLMNHELKNNNTKLILEKEYHPDLMLNGDMNSLVQVLNNLIGNAIYAEKDLKTKLIFLRAEETGNCLEIRVQDNGPGIPEEVRQKLFREMITTKGKDGTGLGLYISSTIVRGKFGGELWYEDAPDGGAVMCIRLPLSKH